MWESLKEYIPLAVHWDREGDRNYNDEIVPYLTPACLYLEAGGIYSVDQVRQDGMLPSFQSGGYGIRYTVRTSCDSEQNYNKVFYLYYEGFGQPGRWRHGDQYVSVDVIWDEKGGIRPTCIYMDDFRYTIGKRGIIQMYPMSTRKADGSGMRYIVKATCRQLRDYDREFSLMLENGGNITGRWFYEDADIVHRRKVSFGELDDGAFDIASVEESMGVSKVCARYQTTIDLTNFLRDWNSREHNGIWLPPEIFEKKIRDGIIYPQYYAPVMVANENDVVPSVMQWGLKRPWASKVIHNLRCDNLMKKTTFQSIKGNRCVVPCGGFYEYHKIDNAVAGDYLFRDIKHDTMYLAGLYEPFENGSRYTILTTDANPSVDIHDRMPVILRRDECKAWLSGRIDFAHISDRKGILLEKKAV